MKKVYLVSERTFFKENNTDYAMAFDPNNDNDLKLFKNRAEAEKEFDSTCEFYRTNFSSSEEHVDSSIIFYNKYKTVRYIVSLTEKVVR